MGKAHITGDDFNPTAIWEKALRDANERNHDLLFDALCIASDKFKLRGALRTIRDIADSTRRCFSHAPEINLTETFEEITRIAATALEETNNEDA